MSRSAQAIEANFDGLVGPTHNYAGLAFGNLASGANKHRRANPKAAALQGLAKMRRLLELGLTQGILPPQSRPDLDTLRRLGFSGSDRQIVNRAARQAPHLLAACYSASAMWSANAATVSASADSDDGRVHFTPANLISQLHRSIESSTTQRVLHSTFPDSAYFVHHPPLPATVEFADEGAANHCRLASTYRSSGLNLFVYGHDTTAPAANRAQHYPARQTLQASTAIARSHRLSSERCLFARQHPQAIDHGVFHNDVIALSNLNLLLCHQQSFVGQAELLQQLRQACERKAIELTLIEVPQSRVSLQQAVSSYLFNAQLVSLPDAAMCLLAPRQCRDYEPVWNYLQELRAQSNPIASIELFDLQQSMRNGGGPACLRLRVVLTPDELNAVNPGSILSDAKITALEHWVERYYRDRLLPEDLADPILIDESQAALEQLTEILQLGSIYPFQRNR